jgi:hypothetical protein
MILDKNTCLECFNCGEKEKNLILDVFCFKIDSDDNCDKLCLKDLKLPVTDHSCLTKTLLEKQSIILDSSKIFLVKVDKNKNVWWRKINRYTDLFKNISYDLQLQLNTVNLANDNTLIEYSLTMTQNTSSVLVTWNNFPTSVFAYNGTTWSNLTNVTWNTFNPLNLNTLHQYPTLSLSGEFSMNFDGNIQSKTKEITFELTNGYFKYSIVCEITLDKLNNTITNEIKSVILTGELYSEEFIVTNKSSAVTNNGSELQLDEEHNIFTQKVEEFFSLKGFLFLSSTKDISSIKIFNQDKSSKSLSIIKYS